MTLLTRLFCFVILLFCREEISKYKELDPTSRLLLLKALCEIRADVIYHPFEFCAVLIELVIVFSIYRHVHLCFWNGFFVSSQNQCLITIFVSFEMNVCGNSISF